MRYASWNRRNCGIYNFFAFFYWGWAKTQVKWIMKIGRSNRSSEVKIKLIWKVFSLRSDQIIVKTRYCERLIEESIKWFFGWERIDPKIFFPQDQILGGVDGLENSSYPNAYFFPLNSHRDRLWWGSWEEIASPRMVLKNRKIWHLLSSFRACM